MIGLLITIIIVVLVVAVVFWLIDALPVPHPFNLVLKVVIVLVALLMLLRHAGYAEEAHMHGLKRADADWYGSMQDGCCNDKDCRMTAFREVELRDGGWFIKTTGELIPFGNYRIKKSRDAAMHICLAQARARCLYIPDPGI
jgi:hypothetical protein